MPTQPTGGLHEHTANTIIARWLNAAGRKWNARRERTQTIIGSNERHHIVITEGGQMPVIVECEYDDKPSPAVAVAQKRLAKRWWAKPGPSPKSSPPPARTPARRSSASHWTTTIPS